MKLATFIAVAVSCILFAEHRIEASRRERLRRCIQATETRYFDYLKANGNAEADGSVTNDYSILDQARKDRLDSLAECKMLDGK